MDYIKVTPQTLRNQAAKVDQEAQNYYAEYQGLIRDVDDLVSEDYRGADADAFKNKVFNFEQDFNKMRELMHEYADFLRQAADNYASTQSNALNSINNLR
ncbi:WXG100 family type VII secretion target [Lachnospiraceae bacterium A4]|jgi:WXG100 family type VII secretion target|nr:WXG100 family type VII secretion target [Lachnospiraceae bacterium A4]